MNRRTGLVAPLALALTAVLVAGGCSRTGDPPAGGAAAPTAAPATAATDGSATTAAPTTGDPADPTTTAATATTARKPSPVRYRFPVAGCRARYANAHHDYPAADMFTQRNCAFVAPVAGRVDEVTRTDRWDPATNRGADRGGRSVSLVGVDGVRYYGSHLEAVLPGIVPGLQVRAGQPLGRIGNSGSARVTDVHLHFAISWPTRPGIWWIRRGVVPPARYLDSWRTGGNLSPARAVQAGLEAAGSPVPPCRSYC
jgi:murein DD-endopeptidase MepM/ murein hydrolase activator NlpD